MHWGPSIWALYCFNRFNVRWLSSPLCHYTYWDDANHRHMFPHGIAWDSACGREEEYPNCCDLISLNSVCLIRTEQRWQEHTPSGLVRSRSQRWEMWVGFHHTKWLQHKTMLGFLFLFIAVKTHIDLIMNAD